MESKVVVLGSGGVGKSAITIQFVTGLFVAKYDPTIEDSYRKQIQLKDKQCMLEILDTVSSDTFTAMRDLYMKNGDAFVLVYSLQSRSTLQDLDDIIEQIQRVKKSTNIPMIIVGNKCDLNDSRVISFEEGKKKADIFNCAFIESSAKINFNINEIFMWTAKHGKPIEPQKKTSHKKCTIL